MTANGAVTSEHVAGATRATTVAEAVAAAARDLGADDVFTLMGGTNLRVVHHLGDRGARLHHLRHENGAIGAADGYARASDRVGWSSVTHGPGFTNAVTALRTAVLARSPQVMIMADTTGVPPRQAPFEVGVQGLTPDMILATIGVPIVRVSARSASSDTARAHAMAAEQRLPVALIIPFGVEVAPSPMEPAAGASSTAAPRRALADAEESSPDGGRPERGDIDEVERVLRSAKRIVILAGRGAAAPEAVLQLGALADACGAYLATSVRAVGLFEGSPANLGIFGGFSHAAARATIHGADCIIAIGASLNHLQTRADTYLHGATLVHVDADPHAIGRFNRADVSVCGDAARVAEELLARFEARPLEPPRHLPDAPDRISYVDVSRPGELDPRTLTERLDELLPPDRTIVVDGGHFTVWPICFMRHEAPTALIWTCDFGAIGCGFGPSIGVATARNDRLTALFIGDCGFYMTLGELEVAVREELPLLVACYNDGAAGSEVLIADQAGLPTDEAIFGRADLAQVARGLGAAGVAIDRLDDLAPALAAWDRRGPLVLDCRITRDVRSPARTHAT
ncbi:acetolactate synthase [Pseudoclavibacter endophyticus]|uniref:Thiamine pyrophosphate-binding protein n=1 Tax=Pseudoclavibacter endophyticus TaxID=1778590 RepID=A0A6H9WK13_9MICO|nr:thiamine pyrophosphate-binding protein [Pseudoclavibacter endophyticus]KAB1648069.1 thiamine pyrophosphate-binding protein [Pseudoclavibacter endophyticus]GGA69434.1 acetolactate synthase [Pseudoclavibacter endophyticus]